MHYRMYLLYGAIRFLFLYTMQYAMENTGFAHLAYCMEIPEVGNTWVKNVDEYELVQLSRVNKALHNSYVRLVETKREQRINELACTPNRTIDIAINGQNFSSFKFPDQISLPNNVFSILSSSILLEYAMIPKGKPYFVAPLMIHNRFLLDYGNSILVMRNYKDQKTVCLNSQLYKNDKPTYCVNSARDILLISDRGTFEKDKNYITSGQIIDILTPNLQLRKLYLKSVKSEILRYDAQCIIGTFPNEVSLICNSDDTLTILKNKYVSDIFGASFYIDRIIKNTKKTGISNICEHIFSSTDAKPFMTAHTIKKGHYGEPNITKIITYNKLELKPNDTTWSKEILSALGLMFGCEGQKNAYKELSSEHIARIVIALVQEKATDDAYAVLDHILIGEKIWSPISGTNQDVNAVGLRRQIDSNVSFYLDFYEIIQNYCRLVIPKSLLTPETVSFFDETKITPQKLIAMIQEKAAQRARDITKSQ